MSLEVRLPRQVIKGITDEPRPYGEPAAYPRESVAREQGLADTVREIMVGGGAIPASLDDAFGFGVNAYAVDNMTSQWVYLASIRAWVPPYVVNRIILGDGNQRVRASFAAPPLVTALAAVNGQLARIYVTVERLAPSSGAYVPAEART